jgi:hypothetical protein
MSSRQTNSGLAVPLLEVERPMPCYVQAARWLEDRVRIPGQLIQPITRIRS